MGGGAKADVQGLLETMERTRAVFRVNTRYMNFTLLREVPFFQVAVPRRVRPYRSVKLRWLRILSQPVGLKAVLFVILRVSYSSQPVFNSKQTASSHVSDATTRALDQCIMRPVCVYVCVCAEGQTFHDIRHKLVKLSSELPNFKVPDSTVLLQLLDALGRTDKIIRNVTQGTDSPL